MYIIKEKTEILPDIYPKFDLPADNKTLNDLYRQFNKDYWNDKLPTLDKIYFSPLAKRVYGRYSYSGSKTDSYQTLMMNGNMNQSVKDICDTLLHEMIHVYQYYMWESTGDRKYLDQPFLSLLLDKDNRGHLETFHSEMERLNKYGFDVTVTGDLPVEVDLVKSAYAIIFYTPDSEKIVGVWSYDDISKNVEDIKSQLDEIVGDTYLKEYTTYETKDFNVTLLARITKQGKLPKNVKNYIFTSRIEDLFNKGGLSKILKSNVELETRVDTNSLSNDVVQTIGACTKFRAKMELGENLRSYGYIFTILNNTEEYKKYLKGTSDQIKKAVEENVPVQVIQAIKKNWEEVTDKELINFLSSDAGIDNALYSVVFEMIGNILRNEDYKKIFVEKKGKVNFKDFPLLERLFANAKRNKENLLYTYTTNFEGRRDKEQFYSFFILKGFWGYLKKSSRKFASAKVISDMESTSAGDYISTLFELFIKEFYL